MIRTLAVLGLAVACLRAGDDIKQQVQVTSTQTAQFPSGGTLRVKDFTGELTVEAWDRPDVELTVTKSSRGYYGVKERDHASRELENVRVAMEKHGRELFITTESALHRSFASPPMPGSAYAFLEYRIRVPRDARLTVDHGDGEVHVAGLVNAIDIKVRRGEITLLLPEGGLYAIDASSTAGSVVSDFPGHAYRRYWLIGHRYTNDSPELNKLRLRVGFGDIIILKMRIPPLPAPLAP